MKLFTISILSFFALIGLANAAKLELSTIKNSKVQEFALQSVSITVQSKQVSIDLKGGNAVCILNFSPSLLSAALQIYTTIQASLANPNGIISCVAVTDAAFFSSPIYILNMDANDGSSFTISANTP